MSELFNYAISGGNIIPTILLILVMLYWLTVIIGVIDLDFLDIDFDIDVDADVDIDIDVGDGIGPFHAILAFLKVGKLPFMFVFSLVILNFWIIAMLMNYLPIEPGGLLNSLLLIPAFVLSVFLTKLELLPFQGIISRNYNNGQADYDVLRQLCKLKCDVSSDRLGQAELERDGASIVINVKPEFEEDAFKKDEIACVFRKDENKNIYYIVKVEGVV